MMIMKKTIILSAILGSALTLVSSCDFLDENLKGGFSSENFYTSLDQAELAVNGVYNSLYGNSLWVFGDIASDDSVKGGSSGDQADIDYIDDFSADSENGYIVTFWQDTYETISRANNVIYNISNMSGVDDEKAAELFGETYFLRAYSYFNLVNIFGQVPLKLRPQTNSEAIYVGLSSTADIYRQIDEDLKYAGENLPAQQTAAVGRATKGAAYSLLAKSKLFQEDWKACSDYCDSVIKLGIYGLVDDYSSLFAAGGENTKESIFAIRYGNTTDASLGNNLNVWFSPSYEGGYYFNAPTDAYVACFSEKTEGGDDDPRLDASIGRDGKPWFNDTTFSASWSSTGYLVKKYNEDMSEEYAKSQSAVPQHRIRYADVLLMKAEALNESGNAAEALTYVNQVRSRAGLAAATATDKASLRTLIRNERRKELGFEFHRFFDIMRYGQSYAESVLGSTFKWTSPRFYFPIPQTELDANTAIK